MSRRLRYRISGRMAVPLDDMDDLTVEIDELDEVDALSARAFAVRDTLLASGRLSEVDRRAAVAALGDIVAQARKAERYRRALITIAEERRGRDTERFETRSVRDVARDALVGSGDDVDAGRRRVG